MRQHCTRLSEWQKYTVIASARVQRNSGTYYWLERKCYSQPGKQCAVSQTICAHNYSTTQQLHLWAFTSKKWKPVHIQNSNTNACNRSFSFLLPFPLIFGQYWGLKPGTHYSDSPPPFWDKVLPSCTVWVCDPPAAASWVAGSTSVHYHTWTHDSLTCNSQKSESAHRYFNRKMVIMRRVQTMGYYLLVKGMTDHMQPGWIPHHRTLHPSAMVCMTP